MPPSSVPGFAVHDDETTVAEPVAPAMPPPPDSPRTVFVHLFEWPHDAVAEECERELGPRGYKAVQVSPPQEHAVFDNGVWWQRYQPVSYQLVSRGGDRASFERMVNRCKDAGVEVYVDAVVNHMSFVTEGVGSAGTAFTKYGYPGLYTDEHFHDCRRGIDDWGSVEEMQTCELATLADLRTAHPHVRSQLSGYLADLISLGVAGFRIDAAKHMPKEDLRAILDAAGGTPFVFQEVPSLDGSGPLPPSHFVDNGRVTEFRYGHILSETFRSGSLSSLETFGAGWLPKDDAVVFIDNHDTQRGHSAGDPLTFADGELYDLATAFMLAWPYGYPKVMSSYAFADGDAGPPSTTPCGDGWICEHRRPAIANMVAFSNAVDGTPVEHWWTNGNDQIAFARGDRGFFAMNREELSRVTREFTTNLAPGRYCDAFTGRLDGDRCTGREIVVGIDGSATLTIGPVDAVALHADARRPEREPPELGARYDEAGTNVTFAVFSENATAIDVCVFDAATGADPLACHALDRAGDIWWTGLPTDDLPSPLYYGYRAWGPNWTKDGFVTDVDSRGHRFNPNKLLIDPYGRELSHDVADFADHATGEQYRDRENLRTAPKSIVLPSEPAVARLPVRPFKDEIVYEVHVRGLTMNDPSVPEAERGTFAGAARKAAYLAELGITAIELLPIHETFNDQNELTKDATGDNYWGYASESFFAPDRRYAMDKTPGGPTRELKRMVEAFHAEGVKVYIDVVYNHTAETGVWGDPNVTTLLSWRGLDNASYYELGRRDGRTYTNNNGVGPNVDVTHPRVKQMVIDSLAYYADEIGVDGFRFDLASVLGNTCAAGCFEFSSSDSLLAQMRTALPDVDLIAEPWGIGPGTYRIGQIGAGWAEWNGIFRDTIRKDQNEQGVTDVPPSELIDVIGGSPSLFADDGRRPWRSINYIASHDGFALRDVYACNTKQNDQPYPFGPSSGGDDQNHSWDYNGDVSRQRQAARTGMAIVMLSAGVPMINGGDELYRTQYCNNNPFNLDTDKNWLDWAAGDTDHQTFVRRLLNFRLAHPSLRPDRYGAFTFYTDAGEPMDGAYINNAANHFVGWRAANVYVAYNGWSQAIVATLPAGSWTLVGDTSAAYEAQGGILAEADRMGVSGPYTVAPKSLAVFVTD